MNQEEAKVLSQYGYGTPNQAIAGLGLPPGWGELDLASPVFGNLPQTVGSNQFRVFINEQTNEIAVSFKGSTTFANFQSDLLNDGWSQYQEIRTAANNALEAIQAVYPNYSYTAVGHSLGAGQAQTFALENNLNVIGVNPLPISQGAIQNIWGGQEGFQDALAAWTFERSASFVRTSNDIASLYYRDLRGEAYLPGEVVTLPGTSLPPAVIPALIGLEVATAGGATPVLGLFLLAAGIDHTMTSVFKASAGLGIDSLGQYVVPNGSVLDIPPSMRSLAGQLFDSPLTSVVQESEGVYRMVRADGSSQRLTLRDDDSIELSTANNDGTLSYHELFKDGTYVSSVETEDGLFGQCSIFPNVMQYELRRPGTDIVERGQAELNDDGDGNFAGIEEQTSWLRNDEEIATSDKVTPADGGAATETVAIGGSSATFRIAQNGDASALDVTAVEGVALSAQERSNLIQAMNSAGVTPDDVLAPVTYGESGADVALKNSAAGPELEIALGEDEEFVLDYLIADGGTANLESVTYEGQQLAPAQSLIFSLLTPHALLDPGSELTVDPFGSAGFDAHVASAAGDFRAHYDAGTVTLDLDDWRLSDGPFSLLIDAARFIVHASGASQANAQIGFSGFPIQSTRSAQHSDGSSYSFSSSFDGSTMEAYTRAGDVFFNSFYLARDGAGSVVARQFAYDNGGGYVENPVATVGNTLELHFANDFVTEMAVAAPATNGAVSSFDTAGHVSYSYTPTTQQLASSGFDAGVSVTHSSNGWVSRTLAKSKDGYASYNETRNETGALVQYSATSDDGWVWSEQRSAQGGNLLQRNPYGETFSWFYNASGNGAFFYNDGQGHGYNGNVRSNGTSEVFYINDQDSEGHSIEVPVPFGYSGQLPSHGFSLAERLAPIDDIQPDTQFQVLTVGIDHAAAVLLQARDPDGDGIAKYELRQTSVREGGAYFQLNGAELDVSDGYEVNAGAVAGLRIHGGDDAGVDQFWFRASDGELWSAWTPIGVRTASALAPVVQQTRSSIRVNEARGISDFFQAADPEGQEVRLLEFQDTNTAATSGYLQFAGVTEAPLGIINVAPSDLALVTFHGGAQALEGDVINVRAFDGELWSNWQSFNIGTTGNLPPRLVVPIPGQAGSEDRFFSYTFPDITFIDPEGGSLHYIAQKAGGGALPSWLSFNAAARTFFGTPSASDVGTVSIELIAADSGGLAAADSFDITVAPTNDAPVVTASATTLVLNSTVPAASLFAVTDEEGDAITAYEFFDSNPGRGFFSVGGIPQGTNASFAVTSTELSATTFTAASSATSDLVWVRAYDGQDWSDWKSWAVYSAPHVPNALPVVTATAGEVLTGDSVAASELFSVSDADGDAITSYELWDDVDGGGYWSVNGVQQSAKQGIAVDANDLANTIYTAGSAPGSEQVWARAFDGMEWSVWRNWSITSALHIPDAAPEVSAQSNEIVLFGQAVDASSLFSVTDTDGDPVARYEFWDSTAGNGHFTVNGVEQGVNVAIGVSAAELANTQFVGGSTFGSDQVWVRATDGQAWGNWQSWTMQSAAHATNSAPVVSASAGAVLRNESAAASSLFSVADVDNDAVSQYEFWDDVEGGGYWSVAGVQQSAAHAIAVSAADLANTAYVGGAAPGTEQVWVRANDGVAWSAWKPWSMTSALHIPNAAPEIGAQANQIVLFGQSVAASSLFSVSDADGDPAARYEFWDSTAGNGHFTVNGAEQGTNVSIGVSAADLANTQFVGSSGFGADLVWVRATDGQTWGSWKSWTMQSAAHATNAAPVVSASDTTLITNQMASASSLFSVTDADSDAATQYELWDDVNGGGYWRVNGVQQTAAHAIAVSAADLANTQYVAGAAGATEQVWARAYDGMEWSTWKPWRIASALHIPNAAPVVSASNQTVLFDQAVDASGLFMVTDADNDAITQYQFWDSTAGGGHFTVEGNEAGVNVAIAVSAAQLATTQFVGAATNATDTVWVRANDGMTWSDWKSWYMQSAPHLTNALPVVAAAGNGLLRNESVSAESLFSVSDSDGDAITQYQFWDDVNGGGYWSLDGVQQAAGQSINVTASQLPSLDYVGGTNAGTEQVWVRANDGMGWGAWKNWLMSTEGGMVRGGSGPDTLNGDASTPVLEGRGGDDTLNAGSSNTLLSGGSGNDQLNGAAGNDFLAGGSGDDTIDTGAGSNVIAFNAGGGTDTVLSDASASNTVSLGGGIRYEDLSLSKNGDDLVLNAGDDDKLVLKDWYAGKDDVAKLQLILDATPAFDPNSQDALYNRKVQSFDFRGLVGAFNDALAQSPGLTSWQVTNALLQYHLAASDEAALGGDLAYWYGKNGSLSGMGLQSAQQAIGTGNFGSDAQQLHAFSGLQDGFTKLS